jgi:uncharacterized protein (DUF433 family)
MIMAAVVETHIRLDENGIAWIDNTRVKVIEIAIDKLAYQSTPEQMQEQYPHLSLAQIHAALAYYYDHKTEMDAEIERRKQEANKLAAQLSDADLREKLRSRRQQL